MKLTSRQDQLKSLDLTLSKMRSHWRVLNIGMRRLHLAAEWLMNGNGKRRNREMDKEVISATKAVCGGGVGCDG